MNRESYDELAHKIGQTLDRGTENLDRGVRDRLQTARQRALSRQKVAIAGLSLAGLGHFASEVLLPQARILAMLSTLVLGVIGTYYWNNFQQATENAEVDSELLADDLPINAYLDRGFRAWLEHSSQSPRQ